VLIYELVDGIILSPFRGNILTITAEIIDFGYPQNSEIDTLKTYITTESVVSAVAAVSMIDLDFVAFSHGATGRIIEDHIPSNGSN
jgi:hypothetical protein